MQMGELEQAKNMNVEEIRPEFEQRAQKCVEEILAAGNEYQEQYPDVVILAKEASANNLRGLDWLTKTIGEDLPVKALTSLRAKADKLDQQSADRSIILVVGQSADRSHLESFLFILDKIIEANKGELDDAFDPQASTHQALGRIRQDHPDLKPFFQLYYSFS